LEITSLVQSNYLYLHKKIKEMTIFIGNLSWETEVEDLEQLFSNYGVVKKMLFTS